MFVLISSLECYLNRDLYFSRRMALVYETIIPLSIGRCRQSILVDSIMPRCPATELSIPRNDSLFFLQITVSGIDSRHRNVKAIGPENDENFLLFCIHDLCTTSKSKWTLLKRKWTHYNLKGTPSKLKGKSIFVSGNFIISFLEVLVFFRLKNVNTLYSNILTKKIKFYKNFISW